MNWDEYKEGFDRILNAGTDEGIYADPDYKEYVKLNRSRVNRWLKRGELLEDTQNLISNIDQPQQWVLIAEHWCGDAANVAPMIFLLSELNDGITLDIQLRDGDSEIENYLTNGGRAIPKLIVRDKDGKDLFTWGPRPKGAYDLVQEHKQSDLSPIERKAELQHWYNNNKGQEIQQELTELLKQHTQEVIP